MWQRGGGNDSGDWIAMNQWDHRNSSAHVVAKHCKITQTHWTGGENTHTHTVHENPEAVHGYLPDRKRGCFFQSSAQRAWLVLDA